MRHSTRSPHRTAEVAPAGAHVEAQALTLRQAGSTGAILVLLALPAWVLTVRQARGMGFVPGTLGMALPFFLSMCS
jgi:hypothetical protein